MTDASWQFLTTIAEKGLAPVLLAYLAYRLGRSLESQKQTAALAQEVFKKRLVAYDEIGKAMGEDLYAIHGLLGAVKAHLAAPAATAGQDYSSLNARYHQTFSDLVERKKGLVALLPYLEEDVQLAFTGGLTASIEIDGLLATPPAAGQDLIATLEAAGTRLTQECTATTAAITRHVSSATSKSA